MHLRRPSHGYAVAELDTGRSLEVPLAVLTSKALPSAIDIDGQAQKGFSDPESPFLAFIDRVAMGDVHHWLSPGLGDATGFCR